MRVQKLSFHMIMRKNAAKPENIFCLARMDSISEFLKHLAFQPIEMVLVVILIATESEPNQGTGLYIYGNLRSSFSINDCPF